MKKTATRSTLINLFPVTGILLGILSHTTVSQNCGCGPNVCCSRFGVCGATNQSCAVGCQQGPCTADVSISDIVTPTFFNGIISAADSGCSGKDFYSRRAFLDAVKSYPQFARDAVSRKQEIAAFFAHVTHETGRYPSHATSKGFGSYITLRPPPPPSLPPPPPPRLDFCYVEEINGPGMDYCDRTNTEYPCAPSKGYYGRGPIMLSWNYNYGPAGESIGFDGLRAPETVAKDAIISFKTALWFWMENVHSVMTSGKGFGETIRAINGAIECNGRSPAIVQARVGYYTTYCTQLGVPPGDNLSC